MNANMSATSVRELPLPAWMISSPAVERASQTRIEAGEHTTTSTTLGLDSPNHGKSSSQLGEFQF
jgi:hypothetical protein